MRTKTFNTRLLAGAALFAFAATAGVAQAQEADAATTGVDEIIVTAQKREQSIQDVPIAVTALGEETLKVNRVENVANLTGLAPGLIARRNPGSSGSPNFAMRGVFASASVPSQDRQISMYIDGVYLGGNRASVFDLPDLQRIEVLRGPQGTLFGRNATAGAISIVTRDPAGEFGVLQELTVGNEARFRTRTTVDLPRFGPFTAFVTFVHDENRGDVRNLGAGTIFDRTNPFTSDTTSSSPEYLGGKNSEGVFAALRYDDGGALKATYKFDWNKNTNVPEMRGVTAINSNDFVGGMLAAVLAAQPADGGRYGPSALVVGNKRPDAYNNGWSQEGWQRGQGHNLTVELQASDSLSLKNITAYRKASVLSFNTVAGLDGMELTAAAIAPYARFAAISSLSGRGINVADPANAALVGATIQGTAAALAPAVGTYFSTYSGHSYGRSWQFSNELQANYNSDFVTVTAGLLYYEAFELSSGMPGFRPNWAFQPVASLLPMGSIQKLTNKSVSMAAYAQAEFPITSQLGLVVGGRLTRDKKTGGVELGGTLQGTRTGGSIVGTTNLPYAFKKTKPTYSVGLNYQPNSDTLVYAKYSTAFLSGGAVADLPFPPETVKSAEGGVKVDLFDRKVRVNLTGWVAEYSNAQAANSGTCCGRPELSVIVLSNGKLKAHGVEAELNVAPLPGLSFGGSAGYTVNKQSGTDPLLSQGRQTRPTNAPKLAGTANITYVTPPLFGDATMLFRLDSTFQTKMRMYPYTDVATRNAAFAPYEFIKGRAIINGRVALRDIDLGNGGNMEIGLWGKNLRNNRDVLYAFNFADILVTSSYEEARSYGLDVIVKFKP